jgi:virulence-associated protein VagC
MTTVEIIETGNGQAIPLPEEFRFKTGTISIRRQVKPLFWSR